MRISSSKLNVRSFIGHPLIVRDETRRDVIDGIPPIVSPLFGFYFQASPGPRTGYMHVDFLVPDNWMVIPSLSIVSGDPGGQVGGGLIDGTWTTGTLGAFIGAANGVVRRRSRAVC